MTQLNSPSSGGIEQTAQSSPTIYDAFQTRDVCESNDFDSPQSDGSTLKIDSKATKRRTDSPDASQSYETSNLVDHEESRRGFGKFIQQQVQYTPNIPYQTPIQSSFYFGKSTFQNVPNVSALHFEHFSNPLF
jgi:hypothetical protein